MRVLVTGHDGYIGTALVPIFEAAGHEVEGLDSYLFSECSFGTEIPPRRGYRVDVRAVQPEHLEGFDAVVHLAGISNDPLGDFDPEITYSINYRATVRLARLAKFAGVRRFAYASSCSLYGAAGEAPLDETADWNPVTPYGRSKMLSEQDLGLLADDDFSPTYLRNATAYGVSPRLRGDLVVNNLTGFAVATGQVLMKSDGMPWRPLVHIEDISRAFLAVVAAPRDLVHNRAFNVGRTEENYRIREVAEIVGSVVPGSRIAFADKASPDLRNYRVNCDLIAETLTGFRPSWTVPDGVTQLYEAFVQHGLTLEQLTGPQLIRLAHIRRLLDEGRVRADLSPAESERIDLVAPLSPAISPDAPSLEVRTGA